MKIVAVYGSTGKDSNSLRTVSVIAAAAEKAGGSVTHFNLMDNELPPMRIDQSFKEHPAVQKIRQLSREADAFILVSPEYHGCMSNWIKNFFDFHYREFAGKLFAIAATTGGSMGTACINQMRTAVQYCHGWSLPYQTAVKESDINEQGLIQNEKTLDRLERMGRDLVVYGMLFKQQFATDQESAQTDSKDKKELGFAGWYA